MQALALAFSLKLPSAISTRIQTEAFWITPPSKDAADLRMALLTEHFGYTADAVEAFVAVSGFFISDTRAPGKAASPTHIKSWPRDGAGRVQITLSDYWVTRIRSFMTEHVQRTVAQAAAFIADPRLRALFVASMQTVLAESGYPRTEAFMKLLNGITASDAPRTSVLAAFTALDEAGYVGSPYIALARANLALQTYQSKQGPGYDTQVIELVRQATARLRDAQMIPVAGAKFSREDHALVNQQLARIYTELGDEDAANRRDWISRFHAMSDQERAQYREGQVIELIPPNSNRVTRPGIVDNQISDLDAEWAERQAMEEMINDIGSPKPKNADRVDAFNGDLDEGVTITGAKRTKRRGKKLGYKPKYRMSTVTVPMRNEARIAQFKRGAGAVDLVALILKFAGADRRMRELAEYTRKRDALVAKRNRRRVRVIPPKPATLRAQIRTLMATEAATRDVRSKQEIQTLLMGLRAMLEESRAAWPGQ